MDAANWQKIKDVFALVLEQPKERRGDFLRVTCGGDLVLREEVESLLKAHYESRPVLESSDYGVASVFDAAGSGYEGKEFGHYKVIREIGRGGMGAVFLAERSDGEFQQQVALKIVRRTFGDSELARRFRRERQIQASLNHQNIARLLDGGMSASDEPYLVMEYVEGVRIDDYCDERKLSTNGRLRLFMAVCQGVSYAHQNLIVHRDIKPSNVLVTTDGTPKLLDFGIAKLLDPEQASDHTQTEMRAFTPDYASPEQVAGGQITTASDVYSLGVLLRDLLHGAGSLPQSRNAPGGWRSETPGQKTIATNLRTDQGNGDKSAKTGMRRYAGAELENIIAMARREDPMRRYASAAQLAEDVQRYLDGLPVRAQKDSFTYRASKFVRRNRLGVAAAAIILLTIMGGIIATVWQARRAAREAQIAAHERDRARVEAAKAERINAFLQSVFASADPSWYSTGHGQRGEVRVVDVLEQAGRRIDNELRDQPEIRAELHHTIGTTFQSLGQYEQAHTHFRAALDAYRGLYGERHPEVAEALYYLAASTVGRGDAAGSLALLRQSLEVFREVDPKNTNVPYLLHDLAGTLNGMGETTAAEQAAQEGLELSRQRYGDEHVLTLSLLSVLGTIYETRGDLRQAETSYQTVLATYNRMPNGRMMSLGMLQNLGRLSMYKGEFKQAETQLREAFDISRQTRNENHPEHLHLLLDLAEIHYRQGAYADAEKEATSALDSLRRNAPRSLAYQLKGLSLLSLIHAKTNRPARTAVFLREALTLFNNMSDVDRYQDDGLLGEALVAMKREAEARSLLSKRYEYYARTYGEQNPEAVRTRQQLERLNETTGSP